MPPSVQSSRVSGLTKAVIFASPIPNTLAILCVTPVLPKMSAALAHDPSQAYLVKMVLGIVGIAMVVGAPLAGFLADKVSRRLTFTAAFLLFAVAGFAPFLTDNLPLILVTRFLMGLAAMVCYVAGAALVADCFTDVERARWMGISIGAAVVVGVCALFVAGAVGDFGWRWTFMNYLIGLPIAVLSWVALRAAPPLAGAKAQTTGQGAKPRAPFPYALAVLGLMIGFVSYVPSAYVPFRFGALGAHDPSMISYAFILSMIATAVSASLFGRIRLMMSARAAFCWCFAVAGVGLVVVGAATSYPLGLLGMAIVGAAMGPLVPNLVTATADSVPESIRGRTIGLVKTAYSLAPAAGVTALEPVVRAVGPVGVILLVAATCGLTAAVIAATGLRRRAGPDASIALASVQDRT